jgi:hypothetical protein
MNTQRDTNGPRSDASTDHRSGHGGHGWLAMLACCIPMIAIFVLIGLRAI